MEEDDGTTQTVYYFINDHLSSASVVTDASGTLLSENRYTPFGEVRDLPASMSTDDPITETDYGYTGQRDLGDIGLMDYNARFYSPTLGRFVQPDSILPNLGNPQSLNRFSYVRNNPISFVDPTGHIPEGACGFQGGNCPKPKRLTPPSCSSPEACKQWNKIEDATGTSELDLFFSSKFLNPFGNLGDAESGYHKHEVIDEALDKNYGGMDNLMKEANECLASLTPEECNNPFWEDIIETCELEYCNVGLAGPLQANSKNLFFATLLEELRADLVYGTYGFGNFDPWWLYALTRDEEGNIREVIVLDTITNVQFKLKDSVFQGFKDNDMAEFIEWIRSPANPNPR